MIGELQAFAPSILATCATAAARRNRANHVQPLIRFDIDDRIAFNADPCTCGPAMPTPQMQGRRGDALVDRFRADV